MDITIRCIQISVYFDCIIKPKDLINKAIELGLSGIAITDHEALSAHMEINMYAKKIREQYPNFTIALGNEIYLIDEREKGIPYYHFILIAKDAKGHKGLRELSSAAWYNSYYDRGMERVPLLKRELKQIMTKYKGHIMATTACMGGELPKLLMQEANNPDEVISGKIGNFITFCCDVFGKENFFFECAPSTAKDQIFINDRLNQLAHKHDIRLTVATDSHYLSQETRFAHKAYLNSKNGDREVDSFYEFAYLMDENKVRELLGLCFTSDTIDQILDNTEYIRQQIEWYSLEKPQQIPLADIPFYNPVKDSNPIMEHYPVLTYLFMSDSPQERYWVNECVKAMREHGFIHKSEYWERLEIEADVIDYIGSRLGTCLFAYFNTFKHYIDLFWECGSIVGPGRGSATGFLSNYLLGITQLDPIKWELPYWRLTLHEKYNETPVLVIKYKKIG